jgi:protein-S-isoprenylcysteine O-methyltransferase Ste14
MTAFVHVEYPTQHPGVVRAERTVKLFQNATQQFEGARGVAAILLAALVAALLVVANQVIETWSDGHLLAAWIALWLVGFAALALLAQPVKKITNSFKPFMRQWAAQRKQQRQDELMWSYAQQDPRLMAEICRALSSD